MTSRVARQSGTLKFESVPDVPPELELDPDPELEPEPKLPELLMLVEDDVAPDADEDED